MKRLLGWFRPAPDGPRGWRWARPIATWMATSLFLAFTAFITHSLWRGHQERKAVEWVEEMEGRMEYRFAPAWDWLLKPDERGESDNWILEWVDKKRFQYVMGVGLRNSQVSDLTPLSGLKGLAWLVSRKGNLYEFRGRCQGKGSLTSLGNGNCYEFPPHGAPPFWGREAYPHGRPDARLASGHQGLACLPGRGLRSSEAPC